MSRGSSGWPSGMETVIWLSTLPSMPARGMPFFCSSWIGSTSSISSAMDSGPCPRKAILPVRGSGSVMSMVKTPLRASLRPSGTAKVASGTVSSKLLLSRRRSARGDSSRGQLSTRANARLAPSSVSEPCSGPVLAAQPLPPGAAEASRKAPPWIHPRTTCRTTQSRARGASGAGHSVLKVLAGIGPILPSRLACMTPAMSVDVALGGDLRAAGAQLELAEHDTATLGREHPARRPVVEVEARQQRRLGPDPTSGRVDSRRPSRGLPGPRACTMLPVNCTRLSPHDQRRGRDVEAARGAVVGKRQMAAVDAQRRRRQPRQQHLAGCRVDVDGAAQDLAGAGQVELRIAPHRHVEALQRRQLRQGARQPARHQPLHGDRELQGVGALVLVGAEIEGPGAGRASSILARPAIELRLRLWSRSISSSGTRQMLLRLPLSITTVADLSPTSRK